MKKYELVNYNESLGLYRIKALRTFSDVKLGDMGGWISCENNLSHYGNAWVSGKAQVYGNAQVSGNAKVSGNAQVNGKAQVYGNAIVTGDAIVSGNADYIVFKNSLTSGRYFTYTKSNNSWKIGCFLGTTDTLVDHLESVGTVIQQKEYMLYIDLVKRLNKKGE